MGAAWLVLPSHSRNSAVSAAIAGSTFLPCLHSLTFSLVDFSLPWLHRILQLKSLRKPAPRINHEFIITKRVIRRRLRHSRKSWSNGIAWESWEDSKLDGRVAVRSRRWNCGTYSSKLFQFPSGVNEIKKLIIPPAKPQTQTRGDSYCSLVFLWKSLIIIKVIVESQPFINRKRMELIYENIFNGSVCTWCIALRSDVPAEFRRFELAKHSATVAQKAASHLGVENRCNPVSGSR